MEDVRGTGAPGKSRLPKTPGKSPRVSISLPDDLKDIIEKEAESRGITVSKYVGDILKHTHDSEGLNIPQASAGSVDLSPVMNAINLLAGEVRGVKSDVQDMKAVVYALPAGDTTQRGESSQRTLIDEGVEATHSAAPISSGDWIPSGQVKKMFHPDYTRRPDMFSHLLKDLRESGELLGREPSKKHWEYNLESLNALFDKHPEYKAEP